LNAFSEDELVGLLNQSREKNAALGITGLLLYRAGQFMEALEGEEGVVKKMYATIEKDPRHVNCVEVRWEVIRERRFPVWSMGFRNLHQIDIRQIPGYTPFMDEALTSPTFQADPSRAAKLLMLFRENG
jgi:hypothetical protein